MSPIRPVSRRQRQEGSLSCLKEHVLYLDSQQERGSSGDHKDILSYTIMYQLWHIAEIIFKNLDALSLLNCEKVCELWKNYLLQQRIWQKCVENYGKRYPLYFQQVGWGKLLPTLGVEKVMDPLVYKQTYWKMTNLSNSWSSSSRTPSQQKKKFHRSGPISWKVLPSGRAVSVYNSCKGFIIKVHDNLGFKFRSTHFNVTGTTQNDTLCMDASDTKVVVSGFNSQKVWVFTVEEEDTTNLTLVPEFLAKMSHLANRAKSKQMVIRLTKFIAATGGVSNLQLHTDNFRLAVMLPHNNSLELWDIMLVTRLHRFTLTPDATFLVWRKDFLLVAPLYSGVIQIFSTDHSKYEETGSLAGNFRKIDALATFENLVATAEEKHVRLWKISPPSSLISWTATKTAVSSIYMNDTMIVTGSVAGIVKIWDLSALLRPEKGNSVVPLRRINMKGIRHYPIKHIFQCTYTDLVIIAKYEGKKKKDKLKLVEVKWN